MQSSTSSQAHCAATGRIAHDDEVECNSATTSDDLQLKCLREGSTYLYKCEVWWKGRGVLWLEECKELSILVRNFDV
jgi:hypothetical protein